MRQVLVFMCDSRSAAHSALQHSRLLHLVDQGLLVAQLLAAGALDGGRQQICLGLRRRTLVKSSRAVVTCEGAVVCCVRIPSLPASIHSGMYQGDAEPGSQIGGIAALCSTHGHCYFLAAVYRSSRKVHCSPAALTRSA